MVSLAALLLCAVFLLAYANGANDNFKGVATLYGSRTLRYRPALALATVATLLGSLCAIHLAEELMLSFSGYGLVPDAVAQDPVFLTSAASAAALTVLFATRLGLPLSTTHALIGGLLGAGFAQAGLGIRFTHLGGGFLMPLLISPFLAIGITMTQYPLLRSARRAFGVEKETCVCIGDEIVPVPSGAGAAALMSTRVTVDTTQACVQRYRGAFLAQLPHFEGSNLGKSST